MFVRVFTHPDALPLAPTKLAYTYKCVGCGAFHMQRMSTAQLSSTKRSMRPRASKGPVVPQSCQECNSAFRMGGPVWAEPLYDPAFVTDMLNDLKSPDCLSAHPEDLPPTDAGSNTLSTVRKSRARMQGLLQTYSTELLDAPYFYVLPDMARLIKIPVMRMNVFKSALLNAGYKVSPSPSPTA